MKKTGMLVLVWLVVNLSTGYASLMIVDDFTGSTINTALWNIVSAQIPEDQVVIDTENNRLFMYAENNRSNRFQTRDTIPYEHVLRMEMMKPNNGGDEYREGTRIRYGTNSDTYSYYIEWVYNNTMRFYTKDANGWGHKQTYTAEPGVMYTLEIHNFQSSAELTLYDEDLESVFAWNYDHPTITEDYIFEVWNIAVSAPEGETRQSEFVIGSIEIIPEPGTLLLLLSGGSVLLLMRRLLAA